MLNGWFLKFQHHFGDTFLDIEKQRTVFDHLGIDLRQLFFQPTNVGVVFQHGVTPRGNALLLPVVLHCVVVVVGFVVFIGFVDFVVFVVFVVLCIEHGESIDFDKQSGRQSFDQPQTKSGQVLLVHGPRRRRGRAKQLPKQTQRQQQH